MEPPRYCRTQAQTEFVQDLIPYLDCKIRKAERIRNERKERSFWKTMRYLIQQMAFTIFILKPFFLQDVIDLFLFMVRSKK
jgi:hypothetical protein